MFESKEGIFFYVVDNIKLNICFFYYWNMMYCIFGFVYVCKVLKMINMKLYYKVFLFLDLYDSYY